MIITPLLELVERPSTGRDLGAPEKGALQLALVAAQLLQAPVKLPQHNSDGVVGEPVTGGRQVQLIGVQRLQPVTKACKQKRSS